MGIPVFHSEGVGLLISERNTLSTRLANDAPCFVLTLGGKGIRIAIHEPLFVGRTVCARRKVDLRRRLALLTCTAVTDRQSVLQHISRMAYAGGEDIEGRKFLLSVGELLTGRWVDKTLNGNSSCS